MKKAPKGVRGNVRNQQEGLAFLKNIPSGFAAAAFFDPQYRGVLDHLAYGNEGKQRGRKRASLPQMNDAQIQAFLGELSRTIQPSGHAFLWIDKFHLCTGVQHWTDGTKFHTVDLLTWQKKRIGMGYRTRRISEYLLVLQNDPKKAKGVWTDHSIPDVWQEDPPADPASVHPKPPNLQSRLIEAVSHPGDWILDPAAGSFSVLQACKQSGRNFLGCDLNG